MLPPGCRFAVSQEVKFPLVCYQPASQPVSVSLVADDRAGMVFTIKHPDLSLLFERDDRFSDSERLQQARLCE